MLLQHGADPTLRNTEGKTALDVADPLTKPVLTGTDYKKDELLEAARSGNEEKLLALLTPLNVNCHASDGRKSTPLHLAAGYNRTRIVQLLLQHGSDVHAKDKGGLVPLHNACSYGHFEVTELLIHHGANVNAMDLWQFTPLHEAGNILSMHCAFFNQFHFKHLNPEQKCVLFCCRTELTPLFSIVTASQQLMWRPLGSSRRDWLRSSRVTVFLTAAGRETLRD